VPKGTPFYHELIKQPTSLMQIGFVSLMSAFPDLTRPRCEQTPCAGEWLGPHLARQLTDGQLLDGRRELTDVRTKTLWHTRHGLVRYFANIALMCDNCRLYEQHHGNDMVRSERQAAKSAYQLHSLLAGRHRAAPPCLRTVVGIRTHLLMSAVATALHGACACRRRSGRGQTRCSHTLSSC
jgi:hypothetical protein